MQDLTNDELLLTVYLDDGRTKREALLCERLERANETIDQLEAQADLDKERIGQLTDELVELRDKLTRQDAVQAAV